jgi:hypothetical protein
VGTAIAVGAALVLSPAAAAAPPGPVFQSIAPAFQGATLTRDGTDAFRLEAWAGSVTTRGAPHNVAANSRAVFWPTGQARATKQQSCATWSAQQGPIVQQGVALRVKSSPRGFVKAITVTKNIFTVDTMIPGTWVFNIHVWNTRRFHAYQHVASYDLARVFAPTGTPTALPWRICARVQGRVLEFQAWVEGQPKPTWNSTTNGAALRLPPGYGNAGQAGWYVGHLGANDLTTYRRMSAGAPTVAVP